MQFVGLEPPPKTATLSHCLIVPGMFLSTSILISLVTFPFASTKLPFLSKQFVGLEPPPKTATLSQSLIAPLPGTPLLAPKSITKSGDFFGASILSGLLLLN